MAGFKKIFGKLRRTNSGSLQQQQATSESNKEETKATANYNTSGGTAFPKTENSQQKYRTHEEYVRFLVPLFFISLILDLFL